MSATLNAELFSNYFGGAPMIHIPVSIGIFSDLNFKRLPLEYVQYLFSLYNYHSEQTVWEIYTFTNLTF